ncbi:MAG: DUF305 domain-containing protein [Vicinamibacterales bacterium]
MEHQHKRAHQSGDVHYRHLLLMLALSFAVMYVLMYAMVDDFANVFNSVNQVYMAALMTASMGIIELAVMRSMYANRRLSVLVAAGSAIVFALAWVGIRQQVAIGDAQFLRSMIPHHAGAILMCEEAPIQDAGIKALCQSIIASQQAEIAQMKAKLAALAR